MAIEEFIARKINLDGSTGTSKATIENHVVTFENSSTPSPYITEIKTLNGVSLVGSGNYDFDTALNEASTNAIQNKVIAKFANDVAGTYVTKIELYEALKRGEISSEVEKVYTNEINYIAENVMPSGKVTKVLGKTEKSENLLVYSDMAETTFSGTLKYKIVGGAIILNGQASENGTIPIPLTKSIPVGDYYAMPFAINYNENNGVALAPWVDVTYFGTSNVGRTATVSSNRTVLSVYINASVTYTNAIVMPMLVQGSTTPTAWSQGYTGLKHTHITGIKTTGINLWDEQWEVGSFDTQTGQPSVNNQTIRSKNYIKVIPNATYYLDENIVVFFYDYNHNYIGYQSVYFTTFVIPNNCLYLKFRISTNYGTTYNHNICINISDVAINGNYYPYEEETINIEADLNGVGTASDEINVEEGKKYQRMNTIDMGDIVWSVNPSQPNCFRGTISNIKQISSGVPNLICGDYETDTQNSTTANDMKISIFTNTNIVFVHDNSFNENATAFRQAMVGHKLTYELATPVVTDVEIENDGWLSNLIKDGSITQQVDTTDTSALIAKEVDIAVNIVVDNQ